MPNSKLFRSLKIRKSIKTYKTVNFMVKIIDI